MNKIKFNKFERIAGLFVIVAVIGAFLTAVSVAVKQGWFEPHVRFFTYFENADGVHSGTTVQIAGLHAGSVEDVELQMDNKIKVSFYILGKFQDKLKDDSRAQLVRPFVIGDRVLEVTVGSSTKTTQVAENTEIPSEESVDLMTVMSGKKMGRYLSQMTDMVANLQNLMQAFLNKERTESMVRIFDKLDPLLTNMNKMSMEVTKLSKQASDDENLKKVMMNVAIMSHELNKILPALNEKNPEMGAQLALLTQNLSVVSQTMKDIGPELPGTTKKMIEALNEATVLMKAMQKSFFLKSNVEEVKKEDAARKPAQSNP